MLQKAHGGPGWWVFCDSCSESAELPEADGWEDALHYAKKLGYRPVMVKGAWEHRCSSCLETGNEESARGKDAKGASTR